MDPFIVTFNNFMQSGVREFFDRGASISIVRRTPVYGGAFRRSPVNAPERRAPRTTRAPDEYDLLPARRTRRSNPGAGDDTFVRINRNQTQWYDPVTRQALAPEPIVISRSYLTLEEIRSIPTYKYKTKRKHITLSTTQRLPAIESSKPDAKAGNLICQESPATVDDTIVATEVMLEENKSRKKPSPSMDQAMGDKPAELNAIEKLSVEEVELLGQRLLLNCPEAGVQPTVDGQEQDEKMHVTIDSEPKETSEYKEEVNDNNDKKGFSLQRNCDTEDVADDCEICLVAYKLGDTMKALPCQHAFHALCVDEWLRHQPNCPKCRAGVRTGLRRMRRARGVGAIEARLRARRQRVINTTQTSVTSSTPVINQPNRRLHNATPLRNEANTNQNVVTTSSSAPSQQPRRIHNPTPIRNPRSYGIAASSNNINPPSSNQPATTVSQTTPPVENISTPTNIINSEDNAIADTSILSDSRVNSLPSSTNLNNHNTDEQSSTLNNEHNNQNVAMQTINIVSRGKPPTVCSGHFRSGRSNLKCASSAGRTRLYDPILSKNSSASAASLNPKLSCQLKKSCSANQENHVMTAASECTNTSAKVAQRGTTKSPIIQTLAAVPNNTPNVYFEFQCPISISSNPVGNNTESHDPDNTSQIHSGSAVTTKPKFPPSPPYFDEKSSENNEKAPKSLSITETNDVNSQVGDTAISIPSISSKPKPQAVAAKEATKKSDLQPMILISKKLKKSISKGSIHSSTTSLASTINKPAFPIGDNDLSLQATKPCQPINQADSIDTSDGDIPNNEENIISPEVLPKPTTEIVNKFYFSIQKTAYKTTRKKTDDLPKYGSMKKDFAIPTYFKTITRSKSEPSDHETRQQRLLNISSQNDVTSKTSTKRPRKHSKEREKKLLALSSNSKSKNKENDHHSMKSKKGTMKSSKSLKRGVDWLVMSDTEISSIKSVKTVNTSKKLPKPDRKNSAKSTKTTKMSKLIVMPNKSNEQMKTDNFSKHLTDPLKLKYKDTKHNLILCVSDKAGAKSPKTDSNKLDSKSSRKDDVNVSRLSSSNKLDPKSSKKDNVTISRQSSSNKLDPKTSKRDGIKMQSTSDINVASKPSLVKQKVKEPPTMSDKSIATDIIPKQSDTATHKEKKPSKSRKLPEERKESSKAIKSEKLISQTSQSASLKPSWEVRDHQREGFVVPPRSYCKIMCMDDLKKKEVCKVTGPSAFMEEANIAPIVTIKTNQVKPFNALARQAAVDAALKRQEEFLRKQQEESSLMSDTTL